MNSCRERDTKRQQLEAKKLTISAPVNVPKAKSKTVKPVNKLITYEELMKRAEKNSKNTLTVSDLKRDTVNEDLKRAEIVRKCSVIVPIKKMPVKTAHVSQRKPVKVIKRDMHPRNEVSNLVVLNQKKRDLRSIEQIQKELKQEVKKPNSKSKNLISVKKEEEDPEKYFAKNYSSIISNMFGYDRNKYACQDDDSSDMEADYELVLAEEARSTRLGKREDLEEELKEIERKKKKAAALLKRNI